MHDRNEENIHWFNLQAGRDSDVSLVRSAVFETLPDCKPNSGTHTYRWGTLFLKNDSELVTPTGRGSLFLHPDDQQVRQVM